MGEIPQHFTLQGGIEPLNQRTFNFTVLSGKKCDTSLFEVGLEMFVEEFFTFVCLKVHWSSFLRNSFEGFSEDFTILKFDTAEDEVDFTVEDILSIVKTINVHKSSGIDYVPTFLFKDCFDVLGPQLTYMFNQSLRMGIFPPSWSVATITPTPKSGNKCFVNNWRPISIITLVGKLLEKLCVKLVNNHLEINNILCDKQYGFRPKKSTRLAIFTYVKNITEEINKKELVGSIYLDFAKAFDSINHSILLAKLENMGISKKIIEMDLKLLGKTKHSY